jgi:hypothetical protein
MVVLPDVIPDKTPLGLILPTAGALLLHTPPTDVADNADVACSQTANEPIIGVTPGT